MKIQKEKIGKYSLRVGKSATGKGLFAQEDIPKGKYIIEYIGKSLSMKDQKNASGRYLFITGKNKMINGNVKYNTARYINHSCLPNCEADGPDGHVYIFSIKNIKAGDELTYDYGKEYFEEIIKPKGCLCKKCLK